MLLEGEIGTVETKFMAIYIYSMTPSKLLARFKLRFSSDIDTAKEVSAVVFDTVDTAPRRG
jgi:hypothetical protein